MGYSQDICVWRCKRAEAMDLRMSKLAGQYVEMKDKKAKLEQLESDPARLIDRKYSMNRELCLKREVAEFPKVLKNLCRLCKV